MRSTAVNKLVWLAVSTTVLLAASFCSLAQQQAVQCTDPPGGAITCEKGQLATCAVVKGKVEGRCQTPPADLADKSQFEAWVFTEITKRPVKAADTNKPEVQEILKSGRWETSGKVITFRISGGIGISGSGNTLGSISQQGKNNIAQVGSNNQATINPDVNPNQPTRVYFCNGQWRTAGPSATAAFEIDMGGDTKDYEEMAALNNARKWSELLRVCNAQIKAKPEWLTPYLMCGLASLSLGNKEKAQDMLNYFDKNTGPSYDSCKYIADYLRGKIKE